MPEGVTTARLDQPPEQRFARLRTPLGVSSFGINVLTFEPGQRNRIHRHKRQEEVYVVLCGRLTLSIEGEERVLEHGDVARVAPDVRRQLINRDAAPCVVLALGGDGEHVGRDGRAWAEWDSVESGPPQEIPLPADVPVAERPAGA